MSFTSLFELNPAETAFLENLEKTFAKANMEFARAYYLFATAKLEKNYNSSNIYERYPMLQDDATFKRLKPLYDANHNNEEIKRLFVESLGTYISNQVAHESDEITNLKNNLKIDVTDLDIKDKNGNLLTYILFEDTSELFKRLEEKEKREILYQRLADAYAETITDKFIELFDKQNRLLSDLGYTDFIAFYSNATGHPLTVLGENAKKLVCQTDELYKPLISDYYKNRTGLSFEQASRADIPFVFSGKSTEMSAIDAKFPHYMLVKLAVNTFDTMGLDFSNIAKTVDFLTLEEYFKEVNQPERTFRIMLDIAHRQGKRSRAYVYPAQVPNEVYLSVKPEGGLDDFSAFFHESGHALHFAYINPGLSYPMALMGSNAVTESYAYLFQNLFLNKHWLVKMAGLTPEEAKLAVKRSALNDLYMLRRYASKMQFELILYDGTHLGNKPADYANLLTEGTGFKYYAEGWSRDVDAGFYVADYFIAWTLEAQLRETLQKQFGSADTYGEDWYQNPDAGMFLKELWKHGNLTAVELSKHLGYNDPSNVESLLQLMNQNLRC